MPRFKTFDAPDKAFSEDSTGFSAFETAGRRVGPLYNQAGQDLRGAGQAGVNAAEAGVRGARDALGLAESNTRLSEDQLRQQREQDRQSVTDRTWPFDMAALVLRGSTAGGGGGGGGQGIRLQGNVNPEVNLGDDGYSGRGGRDRAYSPGRASHAAAGLGQLASGLAQRAPYAARTDITDGRITYDSRNPRAFAQPTTYLDHGQLVRAGQQARGDPNGEAAANEWGNSLNGQPIDTSSGLPRDYGQIGSDIAREELDQGRNPVGEMTPDAPSSSGDGWFSRIANGVSSVFTPQTSNDDGGGTDE